MLYCPTGHVIYSMPDLLTLRDDPNRWIIPNMIPKAGKVMVYGDGGTYKSTLMFDICIAVAGGVQVFDMLPIVQLHGPVLVNSVEGSLFDTKDRYTGLMRAKNIAPSQLPLYHCQQAFRFDEPTEVAALEDVLRKLEPILVLCDPLDSFFNGEENSAKETKALRRTCDRLISTYHATFVFIHHEKKEQSHNGKKVKATYRGSSAWRDWFDGQIRVDRQEVSMGLEETVPVVTATGEKMRNGKEARYFSIVPVIEEGYRYVRFAFYDGKDAEAVINEKLKMQIFTLFSKTPEVCWLAASLIDSLGGTGRPGLTPQRVARALSELTAAGLIDKSGTVLRATSTDGSRSRSVPAWRLTKLVSLVDAATTMVRLEEEQRTRDEDTYSVQ